MNSRRMSSSRLPIEKIPHKYSNLPALQSHNDTYSLNSSQDQIRPIQSDSIEVTLQLKQILHRLATYQVRRVFAFCLLIVFGITILDSMIDSPAPLSSLRKIFALSYIFLNYLIVEHLILSKGHTVLLWKKIENLSAVFNMAILLLLIVFIDLRLSGVILPTKIILVPLSINLFFYIWKSKAPLKLRLFSISTQLLYSLQLLLISFKLDNNLDWCWQLVILFIWPLLLSLSLYSLAAGIMFVSSLISKCVKRNQSTNKDSMTFIIGFLWLALSTSLGFLILFSLIIVSVEQSQSNHLLRSVFHAGRYISFAVSVFTVGCYPKLVKFSAILNPFSADYQEYFERSLPHLHKSRVEMYFIRLSSTYFCSLDKDFYIKNQGNLSKLKDHIRDVKMNKLRLKNLDLSYLPSQDLEASNTGLYIRRNNDKTHLGEENCPKMQPGEKIAIEPQENLCYICCSNPTDAVLLECGHGGICMECAVENLKLSGLCMECRQETGHIVRIDPLPKINGIVKAYENITLEPGETSTEE